METAKVKKTPKFGFCPLGPWVAVGQDTNGFFICTWNVNVNVENHDQSMCSITLRARRVGYMKHVSIESIPRVIRPQGVLFRTQNSAILHIC